MSGNQRIFKFAAVAAILATFVGCGGEGSGGNSQLPKATIYFINASPDSGNLQFAVNDENLGPQLPYTGSSTDFTALEDKTEAEGGTDIKVTNADTGDELERDNFVFERNTDSLAIAYGLINPGAEFEKRLQQLVINVGRLPVTGKSRIYILNAFVPKQGFSPRQINFQNVDPSNPTSTSRPLYSRGNLGYGAFADSSVLDIDPSTVTFQARASDSDAVVILAQTTYTFEVNRIYVVIVCGQEGNTDVNRQGRILVFPITTR